MAATSTGKNLGKVKDGAGIWGWVAGGAILVVGVAAAVGTFMFFKKRKKKTSAPGGVEQPLTPAGAPLTGTGSEKAPMGEASLGEY